MSGVWQVVIPEATVNLVTNPSWETSTAGWTASTGIATYERVSDRSVFGTYCCHLTGTKSTQGHTFNNAIQTITPGQTWTLSYYQQQQFETTGSFLARFQWWSSSGGYIASNYSTEYIPGNSTTWTRYILTATPATSATQVNVVFNAPYTGTSGTTFHVYFDGAQLE